jgi:hypothetical protein
MGLIAGLAGLLFSEQAAACILPTPAVREWETFDQAFDRQELERQRHSWTRADGVYLVRLTETAEGTSEVRGRAVAVLKGPPEAGLLAVARGCEPWPPPAGVLTLVFVEGAGGPSPRTFDTLDPARARDPEISASLQGAIRQLRTSK